MTECYNLCRTRSKAGRIWSGWQRLLEILSFRVSQSEAGLADMHSRNRGESGPSATYSQNSESVNRRAEKIMTVYGNSILRLSYSYLHNMSDAEEILQETLIQFLKTAPDFENESHEKAWLMRVAGNLSKNRILYNKNRSADELSNTLAAEQREDLSFVWDAVKSLPVSYREIIHLFYMEGYSTVEIAGILKKNESTVRSSLRRGRERLKEILKEVYDFEETI